MGNTVGVEIVESRGDLVGEHLGTTFGNGELSLFQVAEKISTIQLLHDDVDIILILKYIQ